MSTPGYDARDVLEGFVANLNGSEDGAIRDAAELAYPKDVIKSVLQHCIRTIDSPEQRQFLRRAYLSLGSFQELSDGERQALSALREVGPPGPPGSELQAEQAKRISDVAGPLQVVLDRLRAETAVLTQELRLLPGQD